MGNQTSKIGIRNSKMPKKLTEAHVHSVNVNDGKEIFICGSGNDPSMYLIGKGETPVKEIGKYINGFKPRALVSSR